MSNFTKADASALLSSLIESKRTARDAEDTVIEAARSAALAAVGAEYDAKAAALASSRSAEDARLDALVTLFGTVADTAAIEIADAGAVA